MTKQNPPILFPDPEPSKYQQLIMEISKNVSQKFPHSVYIVEDGNIQLRDLEEIEQRMAHQNENESSKYLNGRGGNNVAENMKKSVKSTLKKRLTPKLYEQFETRYLNHYQMKSQKENYVLYFLFLHELQAEGKITPQTISTIITQVQYKITKYIYGSEQRMENQPERKNFHQKNLVEFQKFAEIDLDFNKPRQYTEIKQWIKTLYLKKRAVYAKAETKVRDILMQHPTLIGIFTNINQREASTSSLQSESIEPEYAEPEEASLSS